MTPEEFRTGRQRTSNNDLSWGEALDNAALGLGEAGEVQNLIKKHLYHNHPMDDEMQGKILDELGDVLFYVDWIADLMGATLSTIFTINRDKLAKRYPDKFDPDRSINREAENGPWVLNEDLCPDCGSNMPEYGHQSDCPRNEWGE